MMKLLRNVVAAGLLGLTVNANAETIVFFDDLEAGATNWTVAGMSNAESQVSDGGLWHLSQRWSASTNTAWYYGNESTGNVGTGPCSNYGMITTSAIDLTGVTNALLTFSHLCRGDACLPIDDDMITVDVSTNDFETYISPVMGLPNGSYLWGNAGAYEGPTVTANISELAGHVVKIRFTAAFSQYCGEHLDLSECPATEGYYIDDIKVSGNVEIPEE